MFAGRVPIRRSPTAGTPHSPDELAREQQACLSPPFSGLLGNPDIERQISNAMAAAIATPNRGREGDTPANGSEYGFLAGQFPWLGPRAGPITTNRQEHWVDFDPDNAPFPAPLVTPRDLTGIHVHQSSGLPGLSAQDLAVTQATPDGPGINIVAIDRNGKRYCKAAN